ncbi:TOBE domain-containing protein, partial [Candidatus Fermentibacterales bacterium]|nr:TOBE domain-containing protein [Candidatus Fermentibacterales bacterium]
GLVLEASGAALELRDVPEGVYDFGVRPEDILIDEAGGMEGTLKVVETLGNEKIVILDFGGVTLTARCAPGARTVVGETLRFSFDLARCHLFGSDGRRVDLSA